MSAPKCQRCGHDYDDHGRHGGDCGHWTFTEQRIESSDPADGVEIRQDAWSCECSYFMGSYIPVAVGEETTQ
jgi:hypothetical protein